jgi:hypothetical protein
MSTVNTRIEMDGIEYKVEHSRSSSLPLSQYERIVVWTSDDEYVGDVLINHNEKDAIRQFKDESRFISYDEVKDLSAEDIAYRIIDAY